MKLFSGQKVGVTIGANVIPRLHPCSATTDYEPIGATVSDLVDEEALTFGPRPGFSKRQAKPLAKLRRILRERVALVMKEVMHVEQSSLVRRQRVQVRHQNTRQFLRFE